MKSVNLLSELKKVKLAGITGPTEPMESDEVKVGVLSEHCKRLWVLFDKSLPRCNYHQNKLKAKQEAHRKDHERNAPHDCLRHAEECAEIKEKALPDIERYEILKNIFWNTVRFEHPGLLGKTELRLRKGFTVCHKKVVEVSLDDLLRELSAL